MTTYEKSLLPRDEKGKLENPEQPIEQDASLVNARLQWLSSNETQKLIKELLTQSNTLIADAIGLAIVNHQSDNSKQIVHKLIEASALRKVVEKYANRK